jgi:hypothetical protein
VKADLLIFDFLRSRPPAGSPPLKLDHLKNTMAALDGNIPSNMELIAVYFPSLYHGRGGAAAKGPRDFTAAKGSKDFIAVEGPLNCRVCLNGAIAEFALWWFHLDAFSFDVESCPAMPIPLMLKAVKPRDDFMKAVEADARGDKQGRAGYSPIRVDELDDGSEQGVPYKF